MSTHLNKVKTFKKDLLIYILKHAGKTLNTKRLGLTLFFLLKIKF